MHRGPGLESERNGMILDMYLEGVVLPDETEEITESCRGTDGLAQQRETAHTG
jgi:hypothetical protein